MHPGQMLGEVVNIFSCCIFTWNALTTMLPAFFLAGAIAAFVSSASGTGLGYSILQARWTLDYASSFACILIIIVLGLAAEKLGFAPLERKTAERWGVARGE